MTEELRPRWEATDASVVAEEFGTPDDGLDAAEVQRRLDEHGPNTLEEVKGPGALRRFLEQFRSPLISILLVAAVITVAIGEYIDSAVIVAVLLLNAVIGFAQESKAARSVNALMGLVAPSAHLLRGGERVEVDSGEVVPGDLVLLESGMQVPADVRLIETRALAIDESLLTGESTAVTKRADTMDAEAPAAERVNMAFSGSIVIGGRARGIVVATAGATELGSIATAMREEAEVLTPLQQRMVRFAGVISLVIGASALLTAVVGVMRGESAGDMFMVAVALAVSAIPEGLPVVFTIALAIGVSRMARRNAIVRRLPAVEALGSATVIGSDKTGTLTENRMTVRRVWAGGEVLDLSEETDRVPDGHAQVLRVGVLANEAALSADGSESGDPTEIALLVAARDAGIDVARTRDRLTEIDLIPFESDHGYMASMRRDGDRGIVTFVKGAPERVLSMCDRMLDPDGAEEPIDEDAVLSALEAFAGRGQRVLAMASGDGAPEDGEHPSGLILAGLQAMIDPPREGVAEAVAGCQRAGIRVVMITGDHADTARAIAERLGIADASERVVTGTDLDGMDDAELDRTVPDVSVFARVSPEHKLRVVHALRRLGEMVAVTGDGVNDAPALRAAEIGIAMGRDGTDVAREAADMVLADDDFVSIYSAVEVGRITFDNLRKATFFLISSGAATVGLIIASLALAWPLPMLPAQLLWLNLVTNGLQDVALAFEPGEKDVLDRPPRPPREGVVSRLLWQRTVVAGLVMGTGTLYMFWWAWQSSGSVTQGQSVALTTMVVFQAFHAGNARSDRRSLFTMSPFSNRFLLVAVLSAIVIHSIALVTPLGSAVLRVEPIPMETWPRMVAVALTIIVAMELDKLVRTWRSKE